MQSRYGVSEIPQFMASDGGMCAGNPLFSNGTTADGQQHPQQQNPPQQFQHYHQFPDLHQQHQPPQQQHQPPPPRFPYFHSIPITQQLFEAQTNQFHFFHQEQQQQQQRRLQLQLQHHHLGLGDDPDAAPEIPDSGGRILGGGSVVGSVSGGGDAPLFLGQALNFRLAAADESSGRGPGGDQHNDGGLMRGCGEAPDQSHLHRWPPASPPRRRDQEESAMKEPFWRPLDIDHINRNNKEQQQYHQLEGSSSNKHFHGEETKPSDGADHDQKLFSELEAICHPAPSAAAPAGAEVNASEDTSTEEEEEVPAAAKKTKTSRDNDDQYSSGSTRRKMFIITKKKKKKKKSKQQAKSIASFFERLVRQLMEHQESLHGKFLEVLERRDEERRRKEGEWRKQEATRVRAEARARGEQRAAASAREAAIISLLEKLTGESLNYYNLMIPPKPDLESRRQEHEVDEEEDDEHKATPMEGSEDYTTATNDNDKNNNNNNLLQEVDLMIYPNRWPKAEVEALIKVRSGFETRFQEPGLKGPLWEEVSSAMLSQLGYQRSAKRCKEKWENINKYFRKTKESAKKRPPSSKTCPYFHQLDQLYSRNDNHHHHVDSSSINSRNDDDIVSSAKGMIINSELLDAIVVSTDQTAGGGGNKAPVEDGRELEVGGDGGGDDH